MLNEVKTDIYAFVKTVQGNVKNSDLNNIPRSIYQSI